MNEDKPPHNRVEQFRLADDRNAREHFAKRVLTLKDLSQAEQVAYWLGYEQRGTELRTILKRTLEILEQNKKEESYEASMMTAGNEIALEKIINLIDEGKL